MCISYIYYLITSYPVTFFSLGVHEFYLVSKTCFLMCCWKSQRLKEKHIESLRFIYIYVWYLHIMALSESSDEDNRQSSSVFCGANLYQNGRPKSCKMAAQGSNHGNMQFLSRQSLAQKTERFRQTQELQVRYRSLPLSNRRVPTCLVKI